MEREASRDTVQLQRLRRKIAAEWPDSEGKGVAMRVLDEMVLEANGETD